MIGALIARMHVCADVVLAEGVCHGHAVGAKDPASAVIVAVISGYGPACLCGLQSLVCEHDAVDDAWRQKLDVIRIFAAAQARHGGGGGVRVGCGNQDAVDGDSGELSDLLFGVVQQMSGQHQAVNDNNGERHGLISQHQCTAHQPVMSHFGTAFLDHAVDTHWKTGWRDIDLSSTRFELAGRAAVCRQAHENK